MVIKLSLYVDVDGNVKNPQKLAEVLEDYLLEEIRDSDIPDIWSEKIHAYVEEGTGYQYLDREEVIEYLRKKK